MTVVGRTWSHVRPALLIFCPLWGVADPVHDSSRAAQHSDTRPCGRQIAVEKLEFDFIKFTAEFS